mgnify:CR=1 FL=1
MLAGSFSGKVKALLDERGINRPSAGPSTPVVLLGLDGAPNAGDEFHVMENEQEAKKIHKRKVFLPKDKISKKEVAIKNKVRSQSTMRTMGKDLIRIFVYIATAVVLINVLAGVRDHADGI